MRHKGAHKVRQITIISYSRLKATPEMLEQAQ